MTPLIIPEGAITQGLQYRTDADTARWALGDLCAALVDEFTPPFLKADVLRTFANAIGENFDSLRAYEWLARAVTCETRDAHPLVSYSQWRVLARLEDRPGVLAWGYAWADAHGGKFPPVSVLERYKAELKNGQTETDYHRAKLVDTVERYVSELQAQTETGESEAPAVLTARVAARVLRLNGETARGARQLWALVRAMDGMGG